MSVQFGAVRFGRLATQTIYVETPGTDMSKPKKQALTVQGPVASSRLSSPVMGKMVTEKQFVAEFHRTVAGFPENTTVILDQESTHINVTVHTPDLGWSKMYTILRDGTIPNLSHAHLTAGEVINRELILDALALRDRLTKAVTDEQSTNQDRFEKLQRTEVPENS